MDDINNNTVLTLATGKGVLEVVYISIPHIISVEPYRGHTSTGGPDLRVRVITAHNQSYLSKCMEEQEVIDFCKQVAIKMSRC